MISDHSPRSNFLPVHYSHKTRSSSLPVQHMCVHAKTPACNFYSSEKDFFKWRKSVTEGVALHCHKLVKRSHRRAWKAWSVKYRGDAWENKRSAYRKESRNQACAGQGSACSCRTRPASSAKTAVLLPWCSRSSYLPTCLTPAVCTMRITFQAQSATSVILCLIPMPSQPNGFSQFRRCNGKATPR